MIMVTAEKKGSKAESSQFYINKNLKKTDVKKGGEFFLVGNYEIKVYICEKR